MFQVVAYPDHGSKHEAPSGSQKKKNKRKKKTHVSMTDHGIRDAKRRGKRRTGEPSLGGKSTALCLTVAV